MSDIHRALTRPAAALFPLLTNPGALTHKELKSTTKLATYKPSSALLNMEPQFRGRVKVEPYANTPVLIDDSFVKKFIPDVLKKELERADYSEYKRQRRIELLKAEREARMASKVVHARQETKKKTFKNSQVADKLLNEFLKLLNENALPYSSLFLSSFVVHRAEYNHGANYCTFYWKVDESYEAKKGDIVAKLEIVRHLLRHELSQRLRFKSMPKIVFSEEENQSL